MKIIFLDIDGVLNVISQGRDRFGAIFHQHFVNNLKHIIDNTDAKIVISSTWRMSGLEIMQEMWKERNLPGEVIGITPTNMSWLHNRGAEIKDWLDKHRNVNNYVIIDDDDDMLPSQTNNFVRTANNIDHPDCIDIGYGLTRICAAKAIGILN
jgi:hypothetical protein